MKRGHILITVALLIVGSVSFSHAQSGKWVKGKDGIYRLQDGGTVSSGSPAAPSYDLEVISTGEYPTDLEPPQQATGTWKKDADGVYRFYQTQHQDKNPVLSSPAPMGKITTIPAAPVMPEEKKSATVLPARGLRDNELMKVETTQGQRLWNQNSEGFYVFGTGSSSSQSPASRRPKTDLSKTFLDRIEGLTFVNVKSANRDLPIARGIRVMSLEPLQDAKFGEAVGVFVGGPLTLGVSVEIEGIVRQYYAQKARAVKNVFIPRQEFKSGVVFIMIEEQ